MAAQLSPQHSLTAAEGFVDAGDLLLATDLLQVVSLLTQVVAGTAPIGAGGDRTVLVVAGDVETGGAVEVDSKVWLLHVNTVITWTGSQLSQEFLGVAGGGQLPTIRVLTGRVTQLTIIIQS